MKFPHLIFLNPLFYWLVEYEIRSICKPVSYTHLDVYKRQRIYRLTRIVGLQAVIRRKRPKYQCSTPEITAENILNREFTAEGLNEKWLTDVTEFKYDNGEKLYLGAILDLKDKGIVSFAIGKNNNNKLVFTPLI